MPQRKLNKNKTRRKRTEADLACFKLIINNQGQFVIEKSLYPKDKINLHFKKENAGLIHAMLRESNTRFDSLTELYELLLKDLT